MTSNYLTPAEIATRLRVSKMSIYRLCTTGELPSVRVGRSVRVTEDALAAYLNRDAERTTRSML